MRYKKLIISSLLIFIVFTSFASAEDGELSYNYLDTTYFNTSIIRGTLTSDSNYFHYIHSNSSFSYYPNFADFNTYLYLEKDKEYIFEFDYYLNPNYGSSERSINLAVNLISPSGTSKRIDTFSRSASTATGNKTTHTIKFVSDFTGLHTFNFHGTNIFRQIDFKFGDFRTTASVPGRLDNFNLYLESTITKINSSWNAVENADYYEVYLNGKLIDTITNTNYLFSNLVHDKEYLVKVIAISDEHIPSLVEKPIKTKNYFVGYPTDIGSDAGMTWGKVYWSEVESTEHYEVRLDNGTVIETSNLYHKFEGLQPNTEYTAYIRQKSLNGDYSEWTSITFKTLPPLEVPPNPPNEIKILSVGQNYIEVEVSETAYTDNYTFYINGNLIQTQVDRIYRFDNLQANTNYYIGVSANNEHGSSGRRSINAKTSKHDYPVVTSANTKPKNISNDSVIPEYNDRIQEITWTSENVKEGYRVYIDGVLIGEFDSTTNFTEINLDEIEGLEDKDSYELEIIPIDENGKPYKLKFNTLTTNSDFNNVLEDIRQGALDLIRGGLYLLLIILGICIAFFGAKWLYVKFKLWMATSTPDQLEDTTDNVVSVDMLEFTDKVDRSALKSERKAEKSFVVDSKDINDIELSSKKEQDYKDKINKEFNRLNRMKKEDISHMYSSMGLSLVDSNGKSKTKKDMALELAEIKYTYFKPSEHFKYKPNEVNNKVKSLENKILELERGEK